MSASRAMNNSRAQSGTRHFLKTHMEISGKDFNAVGSGIFFQLRQKGRRGVLAFKFIKTLNLVIFVAIFNRNYSNFSEKSFVLELCRLIGCPN